MDDLKVPKQRVPAEVLLPGGTVRRIALFLSSNASHHSGPERASDLLNGGDDFLPAFDEEAQAMSFLHRAGLAGVRVARELEHEASEELTLPTEHEVEVLLGSGHLLRGVVSFVRPSDRSRLVDFLNEPEPFFPLEEGASTILVNKRHVARVVLVKP